ncbi:hypothetical protein VQH23_07535 [Pararoseomonas sp. SCSIO 73927]|uniref:hypothetical protein n=1 Tax=Pararoseomonas sp. SCSIO 73927 TaxID=3114537 RepID=UPI0030CFE38F
MTRTRIVIASCALGVAMAAQGALRANGPERLATAPGYAAAGPVDEAVEAVLELVDEIGLVASTPTRTHEQRIELLLHIRVRIEAVLAVPIGMAPAP